LLGVFSNDFWLDRCTDVYNIFTKKNNKRVCYFVSVYYINRLNLTRSAEKLCRLKVRLADQTYKFTKQFINTGRLSPRFMS